MFKSHRFLHSITLMYLWPGLAIAWKWRSGRRVAGKPYFPLVPCSQSASSSPHCASVSGHKMGGEALIGTDRTKDILNQESWTYLKLTSFLSRLPPISFLLTNPPHPPDFSDGSWGKILCRYLIFLFLPYTAALLDSVILRNSYTWMCLFCICRQNCVSVSHWLSLELFWPYHRQ